MSVICNHRVHDKKSMSTHPSMFHTSCNASCIDQIQGSNLTITDTAAQEQQHQYYKNSRGYISFPFTYCLLKGMLKEHTKYKCILLY